MAEKTILVCDACGKPAVETVTIRVARGNFVKDLCTSHVSELVAGARKPRRGRPKTGIARTPSNKGTARKAAARKTAARKTAARKPAARKPAAAKRRGRPRKTPA